MERVIITVLGGVAYVPYQTKNVKVQIVDWDNLEGVTCPECSHDHLDVNLTRQRGLLVCLRCGCTFTPEEA